MIFPWAGVEFWFSGGRPGVICLAMYCGTTALKVRGMARALILLIAPLPEHPTPHTTVSKQPGQVRTVRTVQLQTATRENQFDVVVHLAKVLHYT